MNGDESNQPGDSKQGLHKLKSFIERVTKFFSTLLKNESGTAEHQESDCERLRQLKDRKSTLEVALPETSHPTLGMQLTAGQKEGVARWCGNSDILVEQQFRTQDNLKGVAQCFEIDPLKLDIADQRRKTVKTVPKMEALKEATKSLNENEVHPEYYASNKSHETKTSELRANDPQFKTGEHKVIDQTPRVDEACFVDEWQVGPGDLLSVELMDYLQQNPCNTPDGEILDGETLSVEIEAVVPMPPPIPPILPQSPLHKLQQSASQQSQTHPPLLPPVLTQRAKTTETAKQAIKASHNIDHSYRDKEAAELLQVAPEPQAAEPESPAPSLAPEAQPASEPTQATAPQAQPTPEKPAGQDLPKRKSTIEAEIDLLMSKVKASVPVVDVRHNDSGEWHSLPVNTPQANPQYSDELCDRIEESARAISESGAQKMLQSQASQAEVDTGDSIPSIADRYVIDDLIVTSDRHSVAQQKIEDVVSEAAATLDSELHEQVALPGTLQENHALIDTVPPLGHSQTSGFSEEALLKLAGESSTPAKTLEFLSKHNNVEIRSEVARNMHAPHNVLNALTSDSDPLVAWQAQVTIKMVAEGCPALGESGEAHSALQ